MLVSEYISTAGLMLTSIIAFGGWFWQRWQERTSVRVAILAEIFALRKIAIERNYISGLLEMKYELQKEENKDSIASYKVSIPEHYCRVYIANLGKLGYLDPEDAKSVVGFYQFIDSVVQDVTKGGILYEGSKDPLAFKETASILKLALDAAKKLSEKHHNIN